jgi:hypothetical protein
VLVLVLVLVLLLLLLLPALLSLELMEVLGASNIL